MLSYLNTNRHLTMPAASPMRLVFDFYEVVDFEPIGIAMYGFPTG